MLNCKGSSCWSCRGIGWDDILKEARKFRMLTQQQILKKHPTSHCSLICKVQGSLPTLLQSWTNCGCSSKNRILSDFHLP
ncbi:hypothetical protein GAYE_PCTG14G0529 [Galdieria yellowstonensis]|uniref:Uncharacterized protein n=1 Tax=Galdieria yellowstonensis TaxID=3028027 RepID=A0AAV9I3G3_9RHOD|nr:hypothetical protein GAYE_PCTG14G0529 [Galdieria yellowstonensis]